MSNKIRFSTARRQAIATLRATWFDGGSLKAYTAPKPTDADVALTAQTLLATYVLPDPIGIVANGTITAGTIAAALHLADGDVAFCRAIDKQGAVIGDFDAGLVGSGVAVEFDVLHLVSGSLSTPTSFSIAEG